MSGESDRGAVHFGIDASDERVEGHGVDGGCGGSVVDGWIYFPKLEFRGVERGVVVSGVDDADKTCVSDFVVHVERKGE